MDPCFYCKSIYTMVGSSRALMVGLMFGSNIEAYSNAKTFYFSLEHRGTGHSGAHCIPKVS